MRQRLNNSWVFPEWNWMPKIQIGSGKFSLHSLGHHLNFRLHKCVSSIEMYLLIQNINYFKMQKQTTTATTKLQSMVSGMILCRPSEHQVRVNRMTLTSNHSLKCIQQCVCGGGGCVPFLFLNHTPVDSAPINAK